MENSNKSDFRSDLKSTFNKASVWTSWLLYSTPFLIGHNYYEPLAAASMIGAFAKGCHECFIYGRRYDEPHVNNYFERSYDALGLEARAEKTKDGEDGLTVDDILEQAHFQFALKGIANSLRQNIAIPVSLFSIHLAFLADLGRKVVLPSIPNKSDELKELRKKQFPFTNTIRDIFCWAGLVNTGEKSVRVIEKNSLLGLMRDEKRLPLIAENNNITLEMTNASLTPQLAASHLKPNGL